MEDKIFRGHYNEVILLWNRCKDKKIFNNAAQHWNHSFYWQCISPFKSLPSGELLKRIESKWGNIDNLTKDLLDHAIVNFGSGWTWLVKKDK